MTMLRSRSLQLLKEDFFIRGVLDPVVQTERFHMTKPIRREVKETTVVDLEEEKDREVVASSKETEISRL